jgi:hypothetical protein
MANKASCHQGQPAARAVSAPKTPGVCVRSVSDSGEGFCESENSNYDDGDRVKSMQRPEKESRRLVSVLESRPSDSLLPSVTVCPIGTSAARIWLHEPENPCSFACSRSPLPRWKRPANGTPLCCSRSNSLTGGVALSSPSLARRAVHVTKRTTLSSPLGARLDRHEGFGKGPQCGSRTPPR